MVLVGLFRLIFFVRFILSVVFMRYIGLELYIDVDFVRGFRLDVYSRVYLDRFIF